MNLTKLYLLALSLIWFFIAPCLLCLLQLLYYVLLLHHSTSMLCSFSSCTQHHLLFILSSSFYAMCCLCILFTAPSISPSDYALCLILPTCITLREIPCLLSIMHVFHTSICLPNHHVNSSSSLAVIQGFLASLAIILRIFFFSINQNSSSSLEVTTSHFFGFFGF
jgi:hypothetical protein